jgi:hypothetical protein
MSRFSTPRACALVAGLVLLATACRDDSDSAGPSPVSEPEMLPVETTDLGALALDRRSSRPGIVFGSTNMSNAYLSSVHTGWLNGGPLDPGNIMSWLSGAKAKGGRVVIKLCKGRDEFVQNRDGTFSLSKWKSLVSRYRNVNIERYIADGTIVGHYLIDEPHRAEKWGGRPISQRTLEEMARFSKQLWPQMHTLVRVAPTYLAQSSMSYRYLDAGWTQYAYGKGDPARWVNSEAAAAKRKGLGLVVGLNVIDGGNGSSRIRGTSGSRWSMSASELRKYGSAMLSQSRACGFFNWQHDSRYYNRSDIRKAMAELSAKAKRHAKTSCRQ